MTFILRKCLGSSRSLVKNLLWRPGYGWPFGLDPVPRMNLPQTTSVFLSKGHCIEKNRNGGDSQEPKSGMKKLNTEGTRVEAGRWALSLLLYQEPHSGYTTIPLFFLFFQPIHCLKEILKLLSTRASPVHDSINLSGGLGSLCNRKALP